MLTKTNKIKCDNCGRFISIKDIDEGKAYNKLLYPDSHYSYETYSSLCKVCYKKEIIEDKNE